MSVSQKIALHKFSSHCFETNKTRAQIWHVIIGSEVQVSGPNGGQVVETGGGRGDPRSKFYDSKFCDDGEGFEIEEAAQCEHWQEFLFW